MTIDEFYEKENHGLFEVLGALDVPWKTAISASHLDYRFRYIKAREIKCAKICEKLTMVQLAHMLFDLYKENWNKLWENYTVEYNPIENYNKVETITDKYGYRKSSDNIGEQTTTSNIGSQTSDSTDKLIAFNTTSETDVSSSAASSSAREDSIESGARNDVHTSDAYTDIHENKTSGNIGVTTSAQMVLENKNLWLWDFMEDIFNMILKDIGKGVYC